MIGLKKNAALFLVLSAFLAISCFFFLSGCVAEPKGTETTQEPTSDTSKQQPSYETSPVSEQSNQAPAATTSAETKAPAEVPNESYEEISDQATDSIATEVLIVNDDFESVDIGSPPDLPDVSEGSDLLVSPI